MALTDTETALLNLIRDTPLASPEELARRLGTSRAAVNVHVSALVRKGALLGRGYLLPADGAVQRVVVVGGMNVDVKARTTATAIAGTSNPGTLVQAPGGVARNVAENLARLGIAVSLISAVGRDQLGDSLLRDTAAAGVDISPVLRVDGEATGTYTAVLGKDGELLVAVAAMSVINALTPAALQERRSVLRGASWLVVDGNLSRMSLAHLLTLTTELGIRVVFEPVSAPKGVRLREVMGTDLNGKRLVPFAVTPNVLELAALLGRDLADDPVALRGGALELHTQGVELVWIRRGRLGSFLSTPEDMHELPALPAAVHDVTGAGDAMLGAFLAALASGLSPLEAARHGHAAAAITVESEHTVSPLLSPTALQDRLSSISH